MGTNCVFCDNLIVTKCLKIYFKIGYLISYKDWTENEWKGSQCPKKSCSKPLKKNTKSGSLEAKCNEWGVVVKDFYTLIWSHEMMNMQKAFYWTENVLRCCKTKNSMKVFFSTPSIKLHFFYYLKVCVANCTNVFITSVD